MAEKVEVLSWLTAVDRVFFLANFATVPLLAFCKTKRIWDEMVLLLPLLPLLAMTTTMQPLFAKKRVGLSLPRTRKEKVAKNIA